MITRDDFIKALGEPDQAFVDRVHATLAALPEKKEEKVKKTYKTVLLVAALLALMTAALAETNVFGLKEFLRISNKANEKIEEIVTHAVERDIALEGQAMQLAEVRFTEAVYDGNSLLAVVETRSKDEKTLLIGSGEDPRSLVRMVGANGEIEFLDMTIAEYAAQNGYEHIVEANCTIDLDQEFDATGVDAPMTSGGVTRMIGIYGLNGEEALKTTLRVRLVEYQADGTCKIVEDGSYTCVIHRQTEEEMDFVNVAPVEFPSCGVRVDAVRARKTALGVSVEMAYTVTDEAAYAVTDGGLWFDFLDENGNSIDSWGNSMIRTYSKNSYRQTETLKILDEDISSLTVQAYECWEKQRFETNVIEMKPAN